MSGSVPDDLRGGGRVKGAAIIVVGTGVPKMPSYLSPRGQEIWRELTGMLPDIFSQDSWHLARMAFWMAELETLGAGLDGLNNSISDPDDRESLGKLIRDMLAIERILDPRCGKFGMSPHDRQKLRAVSNTEPELDELEQVMEG